jgi:hypothetical protein
VDILDTTVFQSSLYHLAVETAYVRRSQLLELALPKFGDDVVVNIPSVAIVRGAADGSLYAIGEP